MDLARDSSITLTMGYYAHTVRRGVLTADGEAEPDPGRGRNPEPGSRRTRSRSRNGTGIGTVTWCVRVSTENVSYALRFRALYLSPLSVLAHG